MKKVKDARKKTAIGQKRFAKSLKRKNKKYNPDKFYITQMQKAFAEAGIEPKQTLTVPTETLTL